ncbi:hypothetical protein OTU49_001535 [Cherax quadricarinatus]
MVDIWGIEFCRTSLCGIMPPARWQYCCSNYHRCCAYVEYASNLGPFTFGEAKINLPYPLPSPRKPSEAPRKPSEAPRKPSEAPRKPSEAPRKPSETPRKSSTTPQEASDISASENHQPSRSLPLQEVSKPHVQADQPQTNPQTRLQTRAHAKPQPRLQTKPRTWYHHPPSYSLVKPGSAGPGQPPRSYNDVLRKEDEKLCRAKFCSLLSAEKHRRCCDVYRQCCAYANLSRYNDPFYFDKNMGGY